MTEIRAFFYRFAPVLLALVIILQTNKDCGV